MEGPTLRELELAVDSAYQAANETVEPCNLAAAKAIEAEKASQKALNELCNEYDGYGQGYQEKMEQYKEALAAKNEADKEYQSAKDAYDNANAEAQAALDAVEDKKKELRRSARKDTSFVVHTARVECSCGTQNTFLALKSTHGVDTKRLPQMLVTDQEFNGNIFDFWGCKSKENPTVQKAAEQTVIDARQQIDDNRGWRDNVMDALCGEQEISVADNVLERVIGECIAKYPKDAVWKKGQENMEINGEQPMLRRCRLKCDYGGTITILLCGQPE